MVPILIHKDMFEPSYNDLKFTIRNCNYVCSNLVRNRRLVCVGARAPACRCHRAAAVARPCHTLQAHCGQKGPCCTGTAVCPLPCVSVCLFFLKGHTHNPALAHLRLCILRGKSMSREETFWLWESFDEGDGNTWPTSGEILTPSGTFSSKYNKTLLCNESSKKENKQTHTSFIS